MWNKIEKKNEFVTSEGFGVSVVRQNVYTTYGNDQTESMHSILLLLCHLSILYRTYVEVYSLSVGDGAGESSCVRVLYSNEAAWSAGRR